MCGGAVVVERGDSEYVETHRAPTEHVENSA